MVAGLHVPVKPLIDVVGSDGGVLFWQREPIGLKVGVTWDVITTVMVVGVPHWLDDGVNVYVDVPAAEVLIVAGLQVPVTPFVDVVGNAGAVLFWHKGPICVNVGAATELTTMFIVTAVPHCPEDGVKVYVVVPGEAVLMVAGFHVPAILLFDVNGNVGGVAF